MDPSCGRLWAVRVGVTRTVLSLWKSWVCSGAGTGSELCVQRLPSSMQDSMTGPAPLAELSWWLPLCGRRGHVLSSLLVLSFCEDDMFELKTETVREAESCSYCGSRYAMRNG